MPLGESWDEALVRLEDFLLSYPSDRALPALDAIVAAADLPADFIRGDDRAHKVLLEAIAARPLSSLERVKQVRAEVELLTLEVEVHTDRLRGEDASREELQRVRQRLDEVRGRLDEVRDQL